MTEVNAHNKTVSFRRFIVCFYFGFVQFLTQIARISTKTKHDFSTLTHIHTQTCTNLINILNLRFNTFYVQKKKRNQINCCIVLITRKVAFDAFETNEKWKGWVFIFSLFFLFLFFGKLLMHFGRCCNYCCLLLFVYCCHIILSMTLLFFGNCLEICTFLWHI